MSRVWGLRVSAPGVADPPPPEPEPSWRVALRAEVDAAFIEVGARTPGWPHPHPDRDPLQDEYSRCLDPDKYRILASRFDAWRLVLGGRGLTREQEGQGSPWIGEVRTPADRPREVRLSPTRLGGLSLVVGFTAPDGDQFGLDLAVGSAELPPAYLESIPDCGCDACDSGSDDLLAQLDGVILAIAGGGVIHARSGERHATALLDRISWTDKRASRWLTESRTVPSGVQRWAGVSWVE